MLSPGKTVGPYRLGQQIGRGASGVVFEAMDEKLDRRVALKVLSEDVARAPEQRARFDREARMLAAVRHPNVAVVYGVVDEGDDVWLALEYLEGETLADILARGPLPIEDALDVARQIADGLEAAHECGVVHRDLKPANVKRAPDGTVKVFDFGLAKPLREGPGTSSSVSVEGLVIGTPLYMSPEQARGKPVDRRADVWALGCVLWELLTGRRPFAGETGADVMRAVLDRDPDTEQLPPATPARVRSLLSRCLEKDPRQRLRDVGDARLELESALAERAWTGRDGTPAEVAGSRRSGVGAGTVVVALVALLLGLWIGRGFGGPAAGPTSVLRLALDVPGGKRAAHPRISPDGAVVVHEVSPDGDFERRHLVARTLDRFEDVPIPHTTRVETFDFSSDGKRLALVSMTEGASARYNLSTVRLDGSEPPQFLATLPANIDTGSAVVWLDHGPIAISTRPRGVLLVHTDGSGRIEETPIVCDESRWPYTPNLVAALPGRRVLASSFQLSGRGVFDCIVAIDLESGEQTLLVENSSCGTWLASGHLLFSRADVLFRAPLDLDTLSLTADAVPVASGLRARNPWQSGQFRSSPNGSIVWWPGGVLGAERGLEWVGGDGDPTPWSSDALPLDGYLNVDETGRVFTAVVIGPGGNYELWASEVDGPNLRPLLADPRHDFHGGAVCVERRELIVSRFGPEGSEVLSTSFDDPGKGERIYASATEGTNLLSPRIVAGGRLLVVGESGPESLRILTFDLASGDGPPEPRVLAEEPTSTSFDVSPDGRWLVIVRWRERPIVRPVSADGSLGAPTVVDTPGFQARHISWARDPDDGTQRLHAMPHDSAGSREIWAIEMRDGPDGPQFSEPRNIIRLEGKRFFDAVHVRGDRYLAILRDPSETTMDVMHVMIGGLADLEGD